MPRSAHLPFVPIRFLAIGTPNGWLAGLPSLAGATLDGNGGYAHRLVGNFTNIYSYMSANWVAPKRPYSPPQEGLSPTEAESPTD